MNIQMSQEKKDLITEKFYFLRQINFAFLAFLKLPTQGIKDYLTYKFRLIQGINESSTINVGKNKNVSIRNNRTDIKIFEQIFLFEDCLVPITTFQPQLIIDGGAHIGCSSVYLSLKYPHAKIIAVEAEESNFNQLCKNVQDLPHVKPIHAAIYSHNGFCMIENPHGDEWGFQVKSVEGLPEEQLQKNIPTFTIEELIRESGYEKLDLLKLDIEGAELEVFKASCDKWLPFVTVINIELHDRVKPGCTEAFQNAVSGYDFVMTNTTHNVVWINKSMQALL